MTRASIACFAWVACAAALAVAPACGSSSQAPPPADDAGDAAGDAVLSCPPNLPSSWQPPGYRHADPAQPTACSSTQVADLWGACFANNATSTSCDAWLAANTKCADCAITQSSAATWGPVVEYANHTVSFNVAGCIELKDVQNVPCSTSLEQLDACSHAACDAACPVSADPASYAHWQQCVSAAAGTACAKYAEAARCEEGEADGGAAAACVGGATQKDTFVALVSAFCGGA